MGGIQYFCSPLLVEFGAVNLGQKQVIARADQGSNPSST
jgi:hypothetical protein